MLLFRLLHFFFQGSFRFNVEFPKFFINSQISMWMRRKTRKRLKPREPVMRALHSGVSTTPKLQFCHHTLPPVLSPNAPFLLALLRPKKHSSLQNSYPFHTHKQIQGPFITSSMAATPSTTEANTITKPFSVLFVCLGNICRSPAAEGVFRDLVKKRGLDSSFIIDSAGTINYHEGNEADPRMRAASKRRGIQITSLSRPIRPSDFKEFDLILAMDKLEQAFPSKRREISP